MKSLRQVLPCSEFNLGLSEKIYSVESYLRYEQVQCPILKKYSKIKHRHKVLWVKLAKNTGNAADEHRTCRKLYCRRTCLMLKSNECSTQDKSLNWSRFNFLTTTKIQNNTFALNQQQKSNWIATLDENPGAEKLVSSDNQFLWYFFRRHFLSFTYHGNCRPWHSFI